MINFFLYRPALILQVPQIFTLQVYFYTSDLMRPMKWSSASAATALPWKTNRPSGLLNPALHCTACLLLLLSRCRSSDSLEKPLASSSTRQVAAVTHYRPSVRTKWVALERNWGISFFSPVTENGVCLLRYQEHENVHIYTITPKLKQRFDGSPTCACLSWFPLDLQPNQNFTSCYQIVLGLYLPLFEPCL